jgi:hypothetical protein
MSDNSEALNLIKLPGEYPNATTRMAMLIGGLSRFPGGIARRPRGRPVVV